jgi:hypothetical protein
MDLEHGLAVTGDLVPQARAAHVDEVARHPPSFGRQKPRKYM